MKNLNIKYGLYMYFSIAGLFLIMKLFGLEQITFLRILNFLILIIFSIILVKKTIMLKGEVDYLSGMFDIFKVNFFAIVLSAISLGIYLKWLDPSLLEALKQTTWFPGEISISKVVGAIIMEGSASAFIIAYTILQYYKDVKSEKETKDTL